MRIRTARWGLYIGPDHGRCDYHGTPWTVHLAWSPIANPQGVIPYAHQIALRWEWLPRLFWRTFERAWNSTIRVHHDGSFDATAWTGRDREFIGWCWRFDWWKS